nr:DUF881 domain-containing protein [Aeromicrobium sp. CFBP 8757]
MREPYVPEQVDGLLEKIADTALDDDYYVVRPGVHERSQGFNSVLTGVVLAAFALLVAIAAIQTRTDRPAAERARETLIDDIASRKALLATRESTAEALRDQVAGLQASAVGLDADYEELRLLTADRPAQGPGLRVTVTPGAIDDISDRDLQVLVNGFWYAGAEAISVDDQRIGSLTSIRQAGGVVKVNYQSVGPPYELVVLGDPEALEDRFEQSSVGRDWERRKDVGVGFDVARSDDLSVEAVPRKRLTVRHATATKGDA